MTAARVARPHGRSSSILPCSGGFRGPPCIASSARRNSRLCPHPGTAPARALAPDERATVLEHLHSERFQDKAPAQVYATLLDEGTYLCSIRTMYRLLEQNQEVWERRNQLTHPCYQKPELLATGPNQVWSWDITKLLGPVKWTYFYLYVIPGYLQPLRGGLDGGTRGKRRVGQATHWPKPVASRASHRTNSPSMPIAARP